jgi:hydroxypyruvate reductase/glycerate 2-kinase
VKLKDSDRARLALSIWRAGVEAVRPGRLVRRAFRREGDLLLVSGAGGGGDAAGRRIPLEDVRRIFVVGAGKAGAGMAGAVEAALGEDLLVRHDVGGVVCVPDADVVPLRRIELVGTRSSHENVPTEAGVAAARRIARLVASAGPRDLVLVLLSGGASALLPSPCEGVPLEDKVAVTRLLQARGADVEDLNAVRKHLSDLKGGGIVRLRPEGRTVALVISDVIGDPLHVIGSGPTTADPTTYADALAVLADHGLAGPPCPASVLAALEEGADGRRPETLKALPTDVVNVVIGNNATAVRAAARAAEVHGLDPRVSTAAVGGDTKEVAQLVASFVVNAPLDGGGDGRPLCLVFGGETTTDLGPSPGLGGRNMEFVLAVLARLGLGRMDGVVVLSGGTDGEDGPTDAAGAWADRRVAKSAADLALDPYDFLLRHDSYRFFEKAGGLLKTGRTGTNVMDLRVVLVAR